MSGWYWSILECEPIFCRTFQNSHDWWVNYNSSWGNSHLSLLHHCGRVIIHSLPILQRLNNELPEEVKKFWQCLNCRSGLGWIHSNWYGYRVNFDPYPFLWSFCGWGDWWLHWLKRQSATYHNNQKSKLYEIDSLPIENCYRRIALGILWWDAWKAGHKQKILRRNFLPKIRR